MIKAQIEEAKRIVGLAYQEAKAQGVRAGLQPRSGFDAATVNFTTALNSRGIERRVAVKRAVRQLIDAAGSTDAASSPRGRIKQAVSALLEQ